MQKQSYQEIKISDKIIATFTLYLCFILDNIGWETPLFVYYLHLARIHILYRASCPFLITFYDRSEAQQKWACDHKPQYAK